MSSVLMLVQRPSDPISDGVVDGVPDGGLAVRDVMTLDGIALDSATGIIVSGACDQRFLNSRRERLSAWVASGGRLLVNGHPMHAFVDGLPELRRIEFHTPEDLWLTAIERHPVWDAIDRTDLLFNTGVPGEHDLETMRRIGVAGFYARAFLARLPEGARVITGLGPGRLPVDVSYPLGAGEVIVHAGNDIGGFSSAGLPRGRHGAQIITYLEGR